MRFYFRGAVALLLLMLLVPAAVGESPRSLYNKGKKAELRKDFVTAWEAYKEAYEQSPGDLRYQTAYERMRFQAGAQLVKKGQVLREAGDLQGALATFQKAAEVDSSSAIARQEIQRTQEMINPPAQNTPQGAAANPNPGASANDVLRRRLEEAEGPVDLAPIQDQAITLRLSGDSKQVYTTIGKLAGVNVLFDPDYSSKQLPVLDLNGVTLQQALDIVALQSNTFWRPVTANTIFVAANTQTKRKELEQNIVKTFYLTNLSTPTELQDVVNVLRQTLDLSRAIQFASQSAIIVRGTPDQVAVAQKLVEDLDKAKPEVIVEVAVMQVRRDKLRDLGIQPPTSVGVQLQTPVQQNSTTTTGTVTTGSGQTATGTSTTGPTTNNGSLTLQQLANINANNINVTIPAASINFLFTDSDSKLIQNPQIRATDGAKASLKIGERIPVATGSFQPGIGGVGINPLVNTQFQYLDVGVNIDITPRVFANNEVGLKVALDISSTSGSSNIGGIEQPIINQKKVEHDIRLREGEVSLLGGILERQDTKSINGIPGLAQVPLLHYLFSRDQTEHITNEIVFVLIPHVVRGLQITDLNRRALDVGTSNFIDLRRAVAKPTATAMPAASSSSAMAPTSNATMPPTTAAPAGTTTQQPATPAGTTAQPQPAVAPQAPSGSANAPMGAPGISNATQPAAHAASAPSAASTAAANGEPVLSFDPATITAAPGTNFSVNVKLSNAKDIASVPMQLSYDPKVLQVVNVVSGDLLSKDGQPVALVHRDDTSNGTIVVSAARPPSTPGISGDGNVVTITFQAKSPGQSVLAITRPGARNAQQQPVTVLGSQMTITVR